MRNHTCWSSNTLATWCEELTPWKRPSCWEGLKAGGEGGDRGWDGWMASLTPGTWVWRWWRTRKSGVLRSTGSQRVGTTQRLNNNRTSFIILIKRKKKSPSAYSGKADTTPTADVADDVKKIFTIYIKTEPANTLQKFKVRWQRDLPNNLNSLMFITVICSSDKMEANKYQILRNKLS